MRGVSAHVYMYVRLQPCKDGEVGSDPGITLLIAGRLLAIPYIKSKIGLALASCSKHIACHRSRRERGLVPGAKILSITSYLHKSPDQALVLHGQPPVMAPLIWAIIIRARIPQSATARSNITDLLLRASFRRTTLRHYTTLRLEQIIGFHQ